MQKSWQTQLSALCQKVNSWRKQLLRCLKGKGAPGTIHWTAAQRSCLETAVCGRRESTPADLLGNWDGSWQFGCNQEHNGMQKRGLKLGIYLLAPPSASQEQGCSSSLSKWNSGPSPQFEQPSKRQQASLPFIPSMAFRQRVWLELCDPFCAAPSPPKGFLYLSLRAIPLAGMGEG